MKGFIHARSEWVAPTLLSTLSLVLSCAPKVEEPPDPYVAGGDLREILERGALRVLVPTLPEDDLQRAGAPDVEDREMALAFAARLGIGCEFIFVDSRSEILERLEGGYGDVVTAQLTVTPEREERLRFTWPTSIVDEWLVGRRGEPDLPRNVEALAGKEIHVRRSSSFAETLRDLSRSRGMGIRMVFVDEALDTETIAYQVSRGKRPLTVVDSNLLASIETYNADLEPLFVLARGRELAWVVRNEAQELGSALDAFIIERQLTDHRADDRTTGDLDSVRARGSLRVITLNNPVHYFLYRGRQMGFDFEIAGLAAKKLGVRLELVVPPSRDLVFDWLLEGRGDLIAATLTATPERRESLAFSRPYLFVDEVVVRRARTVEKVASVYELRGRAVHAWKSSSHYQTLLRWVPEVGPFDIEPIPEDMEYEEILDRVGSGEYPLAAVDSLVLEAELPHRDDVEAAFSLSAGQPQPIAFAVRPGNPKLLSFLDDFVSEIVGSLELNDARDRYFRKSRGLDRAKAKNSPGSGRLSPYDEILKKHSKRYGLDWRLMAAQAYQESLFDPDAESWAGARGLFQLLPSTSLELGFEDLTDPDSGIHAGIRYMHQILERLEPRVPLKHRLRFALAAYNAGFGHLQDARRLASEEGLDPDKWFGHTEKAMLLLSHPRHYQRARHGYVRGSETVRYVSEIQNRYDHYVTLVPF
ncbi:MAG TPA: transporter substrate-binding domain-containing protein [Vicinamibacteria bacterium]|nr:transporter substrate-binding domain-containing protein [Vicinamibacteria bacterium]